MNKQGNRTIRRFTVTIFTALILAVVVAFLRSRHFQVLDAQGSIAVQQRNLLYFATGLSLVVILPVFILTWHIVRTYRVDGKKDSKKPLYQPEWDHSHRLETLWWAIPSAIILVLSVVTWNTSHSLDPYKPIPTSSSSATPINVEVIALEWNWLFLYPDHGVATLNHLEIPAGTPVNFRITADAPMNSFWIPQLGGQVYAMSGMSSQLHLMANAPGTFRGSSANLSGEGYADMNFPVRSMSQGDFRAWLVSAQASGSRLTGKAYDSVRQPKRDRQEATYVLSDTTLYQSVVDHYMAHTSTEEPHAHLY
jgi:cytochrome o ubiquinol oxidase subunit 2